MLHISFQHLERISERRERELWRSGVLCWDDFRSQSSQLTLFDVEPFDQLAESRGALERGDADFFARRLPKSEHYRIALSFPMETLFLDIETTGLSRVYDNITLIGWSIGGKYNAFYDGLNIEDFHQAVQQAKAVVTFNGTLFDLPFLRLRYPDLSFPLAHIDLRFLARRAGIGGPQKDVETIIGLARGRGLEGVDGKAAVLLWHRYCRGDLKCLDDLIRYNCADVEGMMHIFDACLNRLALKGKLPPQHLPKWKFRDYCGKPKNGKKRFGHIPVMAYTGRVGPVLTYDELLRDSKSPDARIVGIDLTGSEERPSGWAVLDGTRIATERIGPDADLIEKTLACNPTVVSIDSPLSLPNGRTTVSDSDPGRNEFGITRECERILRQRGVSVYPCLIPSMQKLTERGMRLANEFRRLGVPVIESYPGAAQDILGIPRKRLSLEFLATGLSEFGFNGDFTSTQVSHDELDAITSALVGVFWWHGQFEALGNPKEDYLIIPHIGPNQWQDRMAIGFSGHSGTGKTTSAHYLADKYGFEYTRFSLVLSDMLRERNLPVTRENLQSIGAEIYHNPGQRWLCRTTFERTTSRKKIVIDGLRHREDHAFFQELFGPRFLHIHLSSSDETRATRLGLKSHELTAVSTHPSEQDISMVKALANLTLENNKSTDDLHKSIDESAAEVL